MDETLIHFLHNNIMEMIINTHSIFKIKILRNLLPRDKSPVQFFASAASQYDQVYFS